MNIEISEELKTICMDILFENKTDTEWALIESDDMFQSESYCGGFESLENAFCFSYYHGEQELWFQITLDEVKQIAEGKIIRIDGRPAEK